MRAEARWTDDRLRVTVEMTETEARNFDATDEALRELAAQVALATHLLDLQRAAARGVV